MCGICGFLGTPEGVDTEAMLGSLAHRGPDGRGEFRQATPDGQVYLGHTRLAIIDLSPTGAQPMSTPDGAHTVCYNGEIYNFKSLRRDLEARGYRFRGTSDTEVVLYLLREEGAAGLDRLRGMFAISFWDAERQELLLARDPFGIKPLYYAETAERLAFASEVRALLAGGAAATQLDPVGLESYLAFGCVMQPHTLVRDIRGMEPGGLLRRRVGQSVCTLDRHYSFPPPTAEPPRSYEDAVDHISHTLRRAVTGHMVADVPVGTLLSGGIDSSGLVSVLAGAGREVDTFSVVFDGEDAAMSEQPFSAAVAQRYGTNHHEVHVGMAADAVLEALDHQDQPSVDGVNTYIVTKAVRRAGISVVLSGLGADEVFLGYGNQRGFRALDLVSAVARTLPAPALGALSSAIASRGGYPAMKAAAFLLSPLSQRHAYAALRGLFPQQQVAALHPGCGEDPAFFVRDLVPPGLEVGSRLSVLDISNYLCSMLLRDSDAMSMAHALELRVPYLDRDLAEEALRLPVSVKVRAGRPKPILVDAIRPSLPSSVVNRRKRGFVLPFARWLRAELRECVTDVLSDSASLQRLGLDGRMARRIWEGYLAGTDGASWARPWALFAVARFARCNRLSL
jgi:asparagine synthase (glutamine-hydrolysing)